MKIVTGILLVVIIALVVGCASSSESNKTEPYEETSTPLPGEETPAPSPTPTTPEPTPTPTPRIVILEHYLVRDYLLFVRGKVEYTGEVSIAATDVTIWVEYEIEGLEGRTFMMPGSIDLNPPVLKPGEIRDFEVLVQDGTKEGYKISVSIMPP